VKSKKITGTIFVSFFFVVGLLIVNKVYAEVVERVVAIVNDDLVLLTEFREAFQTARKTDGSVSEEEVLNKMIDDMLLHGEAKKYRTGTEDKGIITDKDNDAVIQEYIDRRIKALIHIPYYEIEKYYQTNRDSYRDREILEVRDEIEGRLVEAELSVRVRGFIEELRKKAYVRIQLKESE